MDNYFHRIRKSEVHLVVGRVIPLFIALCIITFSVGFAYHQTQAQSGCTGEFIPVSLPLNDLGSNEYIRLDGTQTGFYGGLYPGGMNMRPAQHETAGVMISEQIKPLDEFGQIDLLNGEIVFISVGMSNTKFEFDGFISLVNADSSINSNLFLLNGAQGSQVSNRWADPNGKGWDRLEILLQDAGLSPLQVQVAWVNLTQFGYGDFPEKAQSLQADLEAVDRNLKSKFPNIKIAYYSSRTRAYLYWDGLSPEPTAFETGFAVKWMIEDQINGNPDLNFDPSSGSVVAPYLSWGPYLWIDGLNPRSDGLIWTQNDVQDDCVHPSDSGVQKVANQMMNFFKTDTASKSWFLTNPNAPSATPTLMPTPTATSTQSTATPPSPHHSDLLLIPLVQSGSSGSGNK